MSMADPFAAPSAAGGGGTMPRLHQLAVGMPKSLTRTFDPNPGDPKSEKIEVKTRGRLVIMRPVPGSLVRERNELANKDANKLQVDIVVLDGPDITEVVSGQTGEVETELSDDEIIVPGSANAKLPARFVNGAVLLQQLGVKGKAEVVEGGPYDTGRPVIGRLGRLPKQGQRQPPYALLSYTEEEKALALKWWQANNNPFDGEDDDD
jgi:hypothetical protein